MLTLCKRLKIMRLVCRESVRVREAKFDCEVYTDHDATVKSLWSRSPLTMTQDLVIFSRGSTMLSCPCDNRWTSLRAAMQVYPTPLRVLQHSPNIILTLFRPHSSPHAPSPSPSSRCLRARVQILSESRPRLPSSTMIDGEFVRLQHKSSLCSRLRGLHDIR
jgi:hypothetical protein